MKMYLVFAMMFALMFTMSADAMNASVTIPAQMGADVAIGSPTSAGTQEYYDVGTNVNLYVAATGAGLSYQWYKDGVPLSDGGNIAGALTASLTITGALVGDSGAYTCTVTGTCGAPATTLPVALTIYNLLTVTPSAPVFECPAGTLSFTATAAGGKAPYTYAWSADYGAGPVLLANGASPGGGIIAGVNTANLTVTNAGGADAADYTCDVSDTPLINDPDL